jgi:hypothetical protein
MANKNPDELYLRSREDLLIYEDARFNSLIQAVANFYPTRNDQSIWGQFLRAVAMELARLEYAYSYDLVSKDPQFLTPPDIKRRFANPLAISRVYPQNSQFDTGDFSTAVGQSQYPVGYKQMLLDLLAAYREGARVEALSDVIFAYTGKRIVVDEIYKKLGRFYDNSDRNIVGVSVHVGGSNPLADIQNLTQLQQIIHSLYSALDIIKPAHVGLELSTVFGADENIDCLICPRFVTETQLASLRTGERGYYTQIGYMALIQPINWSESQFVTRYSTIVSNGSQLIAEVAGITGTARPEAQGTTITDGNVEWVNIGTPLKVQVSMAEYAALPPERKQYYENYYRNTKSSAVSWIRNTDFNLWDCVLDSHNNTQVVTTAGKSSQIPPVWSSYVYGSGAYTGDGSIIWDNIGQVGIEDILRIIIMQVENPNEDPMLYYAPIKDLKHPQATLAAWGLKFRKSITPTDWVHLAPAVWDASVTYTNGAIVRSDYTLYRCIKASSRGDNPATSTAKWRVLRCPFPQQAYHFDGTSYVLGFAPWKANTNYFLGQLVTDVNGNVQVATVSGNSAAPSKVAITAASGNGTSATYNYTLTEGSPLAVGMNITIAGCKVAGFNMKATRIMTVGSGTFSVSNPLTAQESGLSAVGVTGFSRVNGGMALDGSITWKCLGASPYTDPEKWIYVVNKTGVPTGEVSNWDKKHPYGLVAPRMNRVWEIGEGDIFNGEIY